MKASEQNIAIPIKEYEHLKECKDQLMEIHKQQIIKLNSEMMVAGMSAIINNTTMNSSPINLISTYYG